LEDPRTSLADRNGRTARGQLSLETGPDVALTRTCAKLTGRDSYRTAEENVNEQQGKDAALRGVLRASD
jgi:hypothetical protein